MDTESDNTAARGSAMIALPLTIGKAMDLTSYLLLINVCMMESFCNQVENIKIMMQEKKMWLL